MEKMRFDQFATAVVEKIREYLPESYANASVDLHTVTKNNDLKLTGLTIRSANSNISPTIYLEQFYKRYQNGEEMSRVLENIADIRIRHEVSDVFDVNQITDYERVKDRIIPHLVGKKWNEELLKDRPYTEIADLAVTYHILLGQSGDSTASAAVTNALMESWGMNTEELHRIALANMPVLLPSTFMSMSSVLSSIIGSVDTNEDEDSLLENTLPQSEMMFVLSNRQRIHGAAALLDREIMKSIVDRLGEDFFILPSSVSEIIIVKADSYMNTDALTAMIQEVNAGQVAPDERLSDHPYRYTLKDGLLST